MRSVILAWFVLASAPAFSAQEVEDAGIDLDSVRFGLDEIGESLRAGDREAARWHVEELTGMLAGAESTPAEAEVALLEQLADHAESLSLLGSLLELRRRILSGLEAALPADHTDVLGARHYLADTMRETGDLEGARAHQEAILDVCERNLPDDHPELLSARHGLAITMKLMGDLRGARVLEEAVLAAHEGALPDDHPKLLLTRLNLANTLQGMGDLEGARTLQEAVLAAGEGKLPDDDPVLSSARHNLANTLRMLGDLPGARALLEAVLAVHERVLPDDHPHLLRTRHNLAGTLQALGEPELARPLQEAVLADHERLLPRDHPELLLARHDLALTLSALDELPRARALVPPQVAGIRARVLSSLALAPRQAREAVGSEARRLGQVLFLTESAGPELRASAFELLETMRMVAGEAARAVWGSRDSELEALAARSRTVRVELNGLALSSAGRDPDEVASELTRLVRERDRLEGEAARRLAARGVVMRPIEVGPLAARLAPDAAAVGYRRVARVYRDAEGSLQVGADRLLAHVLRSGGTPARVDLGPAAELEALVAAWRAALGAPLLRGVALAEEEQERERRAGEELRTRLLDPVLGMLGEETRRLHVCADDLVFLVPLDALPAGEGRVGDRWSLVNEVSFARLAHPRGRPPEGTGRPELLALGGVDYDAGLSGVEGPPDAVRSSLPERFARLVQTRFEGETTAALFEELAGGEALVLTAEGATKAALFAHAPGKQYVHLATHGWFAPETVLSQLDPDPAAHGWAPMGLEERVTGLAPMLLTGLALAGANRGSDPGGRREGLLTAEELASLDLSGCELAVLSACETNVGIRRAGQGIQSLQAALYAAGARSSVTSLWKVDDAQTRRLMELFYTALWGEEQPADQALWAAKRALRDEGAPVRDWAGWVLTGRPE